MSIGGWVGLLITEAVAAAPAVALAAVGLAFVPALLPRRFRRRRWLEISIWAFMCLLIAFLAGLMAFGGLPVAPSRPIFRVG